MTLEYRLWNASEKQMYHPDGWFGRDESLALDPHGRVVDANDQIIDGYVPNLWSGLYDRDGHKIFDQDIIEIYNRQEVRSVGVVSFFDGSFWSVVSYYTTEHLCDLTNTRVIGNTYEHPQLLDHLRDATSR